MRDPFTRDEHFRRLILGDEDVNLVRINLEIAQPQGARQYRVKTRADS